MNERRSRWSVHLFTVAGIDVRVHATMLLLVWLVALASTEEPGGVGGGLVWLTLLFVCVVLHELAHSLVARHFDIPVEEIELLPIGGISKMARIPDEPAHEVAIAGAGPATSFAIGLAALGVAALVGASAWPPEIYGGALVPRIGWFNLLLGGFNLLPALPLDGGRLYRAVLERRVGPQAATVQAARLGRVFAWALMIAGALLNLWLVIIGAFVYLGSYAEEVGSRVHTALDRITVDTLMVHDPLVLHHRTTVAELAPLLTTTAQREFPVVDDAGSYIGMVDAHATERLEGEQPLDRALAPLPPVRRDLHVDDLQLLDRHAPPALAVVEDGRVIGLVRRDDVLVVLQRALAEK